MRIKQENIFRYVVLLGLSVYFSAASASPVNKGLMEKYRFSSATSVYNRHLNIPNNCRPFIDSLPTTNDFIVIIPFEYKQSSLHYSYTFKMMDSVANVLLQNDSVTLSIDGYSYFDEGRENICDALALNRALCVKLYVQGRGVDSSRIITTEGRSYFRSLKRKVKNEPVEYNCTAEITLHYPIPPSPVALNDLDGDGITDVEDSCVNDYGYKAQNGCPNKDAIIVPFEPQQSSLFSPTYRVMDSVITILRRDPSVSIYIEGHAYKKEGVETVCARLAKERADIVRRYLLTRRITASRIGSVKSFGNLKPLNAGRNPWEIARNSRAEIFLVHH